MSDLHRKFLPMLDDTAEAPAGEAFGGAGESPVTVEPEVLRERITEVLRTIHDPEIPLNIYDLGLIYGLDIEDGGKVDIRMTLTAPGCPVAGWLVEEVARQVGDVDGVSRSHVTLVWDPPWSQDRMTDEAKLQLGLL